jgi:hypothetical protein
MYHAPPLRWGFLEPNIVRLMALMLSICALIWTKDQTDTSFAATSSNTF